MVEGHGRDQWNHTSCIIATLFNVNRTKKSRPVRPDQINPYGKDPQASAAPAERVTSLGFLREAFVGKGGLSKRKL